MRVLHVIPSVSPRRGGPSEAVLRMVRSLREGESVDARIVTTNDHGPECLDVPLREWSTHQGVPVWFFPRYSPRFGAVREFAFASGFTRWLTGQLAHFDLLHVHAVFSYLPTAAMAAARRHGMPYVSRPLGQLSPWSLRQSALRKRVYWKWAEERNLRSAAAVHCTSTQEASDVAVVMGEERGRRTRVIPHGIDPPEWQSDASSRLRQRYGIPDSHRVLLFLSRLHPKKGLELLIPALGRLREADHPFTLILAGGGDDGYAERLRDLAAAAGLEGRTRFPGHLGGEEKQMHLQGADLFLLPSFHENFGIAALEALASGCPVLLSRNVDLSGFVLEHDLGVVSPRSEEDSVAAALSAVFSDWERWTLPSERRRIRETALRAFQWQAVARQLNGLYAECSAARQRGAKP